MTIEAEKLRVARDARGSVFEPLDAEGLARQKNVHVVLTRPGGVRGNHFHRDMAEVLTVYGPALVRVREAGLIRDLVVPEHEVHRFTFPPGVAHAILNTGAEAGLLVSFSTRPHDPEHPDVVRDLLIEPQPDGTPSGCDG